MLDGASGAIFGYVFEDINANGVEEPGEPRLNGIAIDLFEAGGIVPIPLTTTDVDLNGDGVIDPLTESGVYFVTGLADGINYQVVFPGVPGAGQTTADIPILTAMDGLAFVPTAGTSGFPQETVVEPLAIGIAYEGSIHGFKFEDPNANGVVDPGEFGVPGVEFTLTGTDAAGNDINFTTFTDANGEFAFVNLFPSVAGSGPATGYTVTETVPAGSVPTSPPVRNFDLFSRQELVYTPGAANIDPPPAPAIDQQQLDGTGGDRPVRDTVWRAQTFMPGVQGLLTQVDLGISAAAGVDDVTLELRTVDAFGVPDAVIRTVTVPAAQVPLGAAQTLTFDFSTNPALLSPGISYALVLSSPMSGVDTFFWDRSLADAYLDGTTFVSLDSGGFFSAFPDEMDHVFTTTMQQLGDPRVEVVVGPELLFSNRTDRGLSSSIHGFKFLDLDGDGIYDPGVGPFPGERPLQGVAFRLTGTDEFGNMVDITTTTDADGEFAFVDLVSSELGVGLGTGYTVTELPPLGFGTSSPLGLDRMFDLPAGVELVWEIGAADLPPGDPRVEVLADSNDDGVGDELIWANVTLGSIHGFKFNDLNGNGIQDGGEGPLEGIQFRLTGTDARGFPSNLIANTDATGQFWFTGLFPSVLGEGGGTGYTITELPNPAFIPTTPITQTFDLFSGEELVWADGAAMLPPIPLPQLDQQQLMTNNFQFVDQDETAAQSFVPGFTGNLTQVDIVVDTEAPVGDVTMEVRTIDLATGQPSGTVLATATIASAMVPVGNDQTLIFDFSANPPRLVAGLSYAIVLRSPTTADGNLQWQSSSGDPYADGNNFGSDVDAINWVPFADFDHVFTTTMQPEFDPRFEVNVGEALIFGNTTGASIHGFKFEDLDADGIFDAGEPPMAGVVFQLTGTDSLGNVINRIVNTDANGEFWFDGLLPSVFGVDAQTGYTVTEILPAGFQGTTPLGLVRTFDLPSGLELVWELGAADLPDGDPRMEFLADSTGDGVGDELIWGNTVFGSIHGFKFFDVDGDGVYEPAPGGPDTPQANVEFTLTGTDAFGNLVNETTMTDATGQFWFTNLAPSVAGQGFGTGYTVTEIVPAGFEPTTLPLARTFDLFSRQELVWQEGAAMLPPIPPPVVDQQQTEANGNFQFVDQDETAAQSFVPAVTGGLTQVDIVVDTAAPVGDVTMEIRTLDLASGQPSGTVLASATVAGAMVPLGNDQTLSFDFSLNPPTLIAGFQYAIVLRSPTTAAGNLRWQSTDTDPYANGNNFGSDVDAINWVSNANFDHVFTTTMQPPIDPRIEVLQDFDVIPDGFGERVAWGNTQRFGQIHGYKFEDINNDGVPDPGEPRLAGWTIQLLNEAGAVIDTVITDANGEYWFTELVPGTYFVREVQQVGWVQTTHNPPPLVIIGGEVYVAEFGQGMLDPEDPREEILEKCLIFGNRLTSSIHGYKFHDLDGDGIDDGEPRLEGVQIILTGDIDGDGDIDTVTTLTDANGEYWFEDLFAGAYSLTEVVPDGMRAITGLPVLVNLAIGEERVAVTGQAQIGPDQTETVDLNLAIGNSFEAAIHGYKFLDSNGNGVDDNEPRLPGVIITLTGTTGLGQNVMLTTQTDVNGNYWFTGLFPGNYTVTETPPVGSMPTTNLNAAVTLTSGEVEVAAFGLAGLLGPGQTETLNTNLRFGNIYLGEIHGHKFEDINGDGVEDPGDQRLNGWTITLTDLQGNQVTDFFGNVVQPVVTAPMDLNGDGLITPNENGHYWFVNLVPGTYVVREVAQDGFFQTTHNPQPITITGAQVYVAQRDQVQITELDPREIIVDKCLAFGNQIRGEVTWRKVDKFGELLGGVHFTLTRTHSFDQATGTFTDIVDEPTVVQDNLPPDINGTFGQFRVIHLPLGRYTLVESFPVPGYDPDTTVVTFELTDTNPFFNVARDFVNTWSKRAFVGSTYAARIAYLESIGLTLNEQELAPVDDAVLIPAGAARFPLSSVLVNDFEMHGDDELTIIDVGVPSMGGTAELIDGMIYYTPSFAFNNRFVETFSYTVTNGSVTETAMITPYSMGAASRLDLNSDGFVAPVDALLVIRELNLGGPRQLEDIEPIDTDIADVNGDRYLTSIDALLVINNFFQTPQPMNSVMAPPQLHDHGTAAFDYVFGQLDDEEDER